MDLEEWLKETTEEPPCGPDLEYDNAFLAFDQLARGKPEQQYGDTVIPAEEPDWRAVEKAAAPLFERSKDYRVGSVLVRAWTRLRGLPGLADGMALILAMTERYWDSVHPRLEIDGEYDPVPRANALGVLGDSDALVRDVRAAMLLAIPGASIMVRDAESILTATSTQTEGQSLGRGQLGSMLVNAHAEGNADLLALLAARDSLAAIRAGCLSRLGPESAPDLDALTGLLALLAQPILSAGSEAADAAADTAADTATGVAGVAAVASARAGIAGEILSREDAHRVLGQVCAYLERHEPTNPAPLLIRRAQRMMTMDFMSIINELAPDSMSQVQMVTGRNTESY